MGEVELLLMGEEEVVCFSLHLDSQKTLHHHFFWGFYLDKFLPYLQKAQVAEDQY